MPVQYIGSAAGILKAITCVIGFFAVGFGAAAHQSDYMRKDDTLLRLFCDHDNENKSCPDKELTLTALSVVWISCVASCIMLIVLLIADVSGGAFKMVDFIGHVIGGVLLLCACGIFFSYFYKVYNKTECFKEENEFKERGCKEVRTTFGIKNFVAVGGISLLNGIIYIITGLTVYKKSS